MTTTFEWRSFAEFSAAELYEALQFRQAIFVVEQASPYADLDGLDCAARHLLLRIDGGLAAYLRLIPPDPAPLRIGRVAVAPACRRQGLARRLMDEALRVAAADYAGCPIALSAQVHLVPFYAGFGFAPASAPYDDYGVPHVDMARRGNL